MTSECRKKLLILPYSILNLEFIPVLKAILSDAERDFVAVQLRQRTLKTNKSVKKDKNDELEAELQAKIDYVKEMIVNDEIQSRYAIKVTTKLPKLRSFKWELNKKIFDSCKKVLNANYATITLKVSKESMRIMQ